MVWNISPEGLYSAGCLIFITTGVLCAYMRWNHMCRPFCNDADYFYPARKMVTLFYASIILTVPYVLAPMDAAVWTYIRTFGVLYYPVCFAISIRQYFRLRDHRKSNTLWKVYMWAPPVMILVMLASLLFGYHDWMVEHDKTVLYTAGAISMLFTLVTVHVLMSLKKEMERFNTDNYSNDEDFPYKFAAKMLYTPLLWIVSMWILFVTGNRWVKFAIDILASWWMVYFLSIILHPQRVLLRPNEIENEMSKLETKKELAIDEIKERDAQEEEDEEDSSSEDDGTPMDVIREEVLAIILRRFREPHLLKTEVLMELENGKMNRASKFISSIGYYNLVNMFRLEYARLYKEAHPDAKQEEIALASGFVSRTAFYKAKRNVTEIDGKLTQGVKI